MNLRIITAVAFKLYAIYILTNILISAPTIYALMMRQNSQSWRQEIGVGGALLLTIVVVGISALTFLLIWRLGKAVLINASELKTNKEIEVYSLLKALLVMLGVYYGISAVINLPIVLPKIWMLLKYNGGLGFSDYGSIISLTIQLILAVSLVLKADRWLSMLKKYIN